MDDRGDWCVLRMSGPATLGVAAALNEAGIEAWTPTVLVKGRTGKKRRPVDRPAPMLPSFAFARYSKVTELAAFCRSPSQYFQVWDADAHRMVAKGCPYFSIMRHDGRYIAVADRALDALRVAERRGMPAVKPKPVVAGDSVRHPSTAFGGMVGKVISSKGKKAIVLFEGLSLEISCDVRTLLPAA